MKPGIVSPDSNGAHNWNPMAFNPATGLVYFPAKTDTHALHVPDPNWKYNPDTTNVGHDELYEGPLKAKSEALPLPFGELVAWDPVRQRAAWRARYPVVDGGGVLATGGNLVIQGRADGVLAVYRATDGKQLWAFDTGTGIMAPPVTYQVDGVQYVSLLAGWGGSRGLSNDPSRGRMKPGYGRILTFVLGGNAVLKAPAFGHKNPPPVPAIAVDTSPRVVHQGELLYNAHCAGCHGNRAVAGPLPDLRYASKAILEELDNIVLGGSRASAGMPSFRKILNADQVGIIRTYIVSRARADARPAVQGPQ